MAVPDPQASDLLDSSHRLKTAEVLSEVSVCVFTILILQREFVRLNSRRTDKERRQGRQRVSQELSK